MTDNMDPIEAAQLIRKWVDPAEFDKLQFRGGMLLRLLDRLDRYEKNLPSWRDGTPEDVDAWLRDLIPDDKRLAFYQWVGEQAVTEAVKTQRESCDLRRVPGSVAHTEIHDIADLVDPSKSGGPFPSELPVGKPFCDVPHHEHPHGGGRLPTCRLDSPEE